CNNFLLQIGPLSGGAGSGGRANRKFEGGSPAQSFENSRLSVKKGRMWKEFSPFWKAPAAFRACSGPVFEAAEPAAEADFHFGACGAVRRGARPALGSDMAPLESLERRRKKARRRLMRVGPYANPPVSFRAVSSSVTSAVGLRSLIAPSMAATLCGPPAARTRIGAARTASIGTDITRWLSGWSMIRPSW